jgi:hypothetical protein
LEAVNVDMAKHFDEVSAMVERYKSGSIVFDCETCPLPVQVVRERVAPFTPPPHPGQFDQSKVAVGNLKDPAKIAAKIAEAEQKHSTLVENYAQDCANAEREYYAKAYDNATLSPSTSRVLAVGIGFDDGSNHFIALNESTDDNERGLLEEFWFDFFQPVHQRGGFLIGHNIAEFDVPFLVKRSWLLGVDVPPAAIQSRYISNQFVDTMNFWKVGSRQAPYTSLDTIAQLLGLGAKTEGMTGADFHRLYFGSAEDRNKAMDYLSNDVELTRKVARRMGLI